MESPKVFNKYLVSLTKIIAFYCFFIVLVKAIAIFRGAWMIPNLVIIFPFILLGISTAYVAYFQKYNWALAIFGAIFIVVMRYYEYDWVHYLQAQYGQ